MLPTMPDWRCVDVGSLGDAVLHQATRVSCGVKLIRNSSAMGIPKWGMGKGPRSPSTIAHRTTPVRISAQSSG